MRALTALCGVLGAATLLVRAQSVSSTAVSNPGAAADGTILLPNGWRIGPVGRQLPAGTQPLNLAQSADGKYLVIVSSGLATPGATVVDVANWSVVSTLDLDGAWYGLVRHPTQSRFYVSGGGKNTVQELLFSAGVLTKGRTFKLPADSGGGFTGGLAITPDGRTLYAARVFSATLSQVDLTSGQVVQTIPLPAEPYGVVASPDGTRVYVSLWGGGRVQVYASPSLTLVDQWGTGEHPGGMALSADGRRLFVSCASSSEVWAFDTVSGQATEAISVSLFPDAPPTVTPNSVAISPNGQSLVVANADANALAIVNVSNPARSLIDGFVPTAWYPTGAIYNSTGSQLFVLSGKGLRPGPTSVPMDARLLGTVATLSTPDRTTLADYTRRVYSYTPYTDLTRLRPKGAPLASPIPAAVGSSSPIRHVFYIIRENRGYDQLLGDVAQGNGDPRLVLFGSDTTPNAHALSQKFVLFDNFFAEAEVSYDGHSFSTAAYATDFAQKMWQTLYAGRGGLNLGEGGGFMRTPFGNVTAPPRGYLWDFARRANVTVRSYGEFVSTVRLPAGGVLATAAVPGLEDLVAPSFAGFDMSTSDGARVNAWLAEFAQYEQDGTLPQLSIMHLGNDHTAGTTPGMLTPSAMVAENDFALGRIVDRIASSVYWKDSVIFVVEDDAQSGADHVDSHRSVLLVASPFAKRGAVDHTLYTTSGVLRTIELILGLEPMSQYDAAATPLYNAFQATPNLTGYSRLTPAVSMTAKNPSVSATSVVSAGLDFSDPDRVPDQLMNRILWSAVKGSAVPPPPPRRSVFVQSPDLDDDDDDAQ